MRLRAKLSKDRLSAVAVTALLNLGPVHAAETFTYTYGDYTAELSTDPQRVFVMDSRTGLASQSARVSPLSQPTGTSTPTAISKSRCRLMRLG